MREIDARLTAVVPSARQLRLQEMEFYGFIHFTVNTFTDREWGDGTEDPAIFRPEALDADQWAAAAKSAGMRGLILTCKHHDGFCLWPSRLTGHSVAASPWRQGRGDVVREVSEACRRAGLAFGVYLSPWDRHSPLYGAGKPYDDYFVGQLTELLTGYGEIFCVWLDGACGEGPNGKKQRYDWARYEATVRALQPDACMSVCGPDVRWCGNEAGDTRPAEWSVVPRRTRDTERIASLSQRADDAAFRLRPIRAQDRDLGSRARLADEADLVWYPAEVNTSIRPGWFWHPDEDGRVKPLAELIRVYENSVGGNATFLLNVPPTRTGLIQENDLARLREFGAYLRESYGRNLLDDSAVLRASPAVPGREIAAVRRADEAYYQPLDPDAPAEITVAWPEPRRVRRVVLQEQLRLSQRIERWAVDVRTDDGWREAAAGQVVGHKRIVVLPEAVETPALRVRIPDSRLAPTLKFLGVYG